jgi:metal transporter CNNM
MFLTLFELCLNIIIGISSGLTVGLIGLDYTTLEVLSKSGTPRQQAAARLILPIVSNHHLLLVTLLLATSTAEEALPLFLERMMPMWASIIVSVCLVLIFAEVIPMALCTRYGLDVGAKLSWLVHLLIWICYPVAWPLSKALDWLFGHSAGTLFKRSQLKELINMHSKHSIQTAADVEAELKKLPVEDRLTSQEVQLIKNALDLNARTAIELSTPIDEVYMLEYSQICDRDVIGSIVHYGLHFCVPVYKENRDNIIGMLRVSDLISLSPDDDMPISTLELDPVVKLSSDMPVYKAMTQLQALKSSLAILVDPQLTRIPVAVLTMEDIIEELVQGQIADIPVFHASREAADFMEEWIAVNPDENMTSFGGMRSQNLGEEDELHLAEIGSTASAVTTMSLPAREPPNWFVGRTSSPDMRPMMMGMAHNDHPEQAGSSADPSVLSGPLQRQMSSSSLISNGSMPHSSANYSTRPPRDFGGIGVGGGGGPKPQFSQRDTIMELDRSQIELDDFLHHHDQQQQNQHQQQQQWMADRSLQHSGGHHHHRKMLVQRTQHQQPSDFETGSNASSSGSSYSSSKSSMASTSVASYHSDAFLAGGGSSGGGGGSSRPASPNLRRTYYGGKAMRNPGSNQYEGSAGTSGNSLSPITAKVLYRRSPSSSSVHDSFAGSEASHPSSASSTAITTTTTFLKVEKKKPKDPTVAHKVEKKLNVANVVATALKRSGSSINAPIMMTEMTTLNELPVIYKRNYMGYAVVDPSKLLSASYGDIHDIPDLDAPLPPIRVLSASHEALPQPDEEMVQLDL